MAAYAAGTTVTASKTQGEIMGMLGGRGVTKIATMNEPGRFMLAFEYEGAPYKITLPLPDPADPKFSQYYRGSVLYERSDTEIAKRFEEEVNRRWRAFGMVIKAKIVAVEEDISTMEAEFIGNLVLPGGQTVQETYSPNIKALVASGQIKGLSALGTGK